MFSLLLNRFWLKLAAFFYKLAKTYVFSGAAARHTAIMLVFSAVVGYIPGIFIGIFKWVLNFFLDKIPLSMWNIIASIDIDGFANSYFGQFTIYLMSEGGGYEALNIILSALMIRFLLSFTPLA